MVPEDSGADDGGVVDGGKLRGDTIAVFDRSADYGNKLEVGVHGVGGAIGTGWGVGAFVRAGEESGSGAERYRIGVTGPLLASDRGATVREAFRSPLVYAMTIGTVAASFAYSAMLTQIIPHLEAEGLPKEQAAAFLSLMAVFGMGGKVSFGYLTERLASRKVLSLSLFVQGICLVALITLPGYSALWLFAPILGLGFGGMGSALPILVQDTVGMRNFGTIYGFVTMATVSSSLLGPLLMGSVYDLRGSYAIGFVVVIVIYAVGILSLQAARPMPQASQMESGP